MAGHCFRLSRGKPWQHAVFAACLLGFVLLAVKRFAEDGSGTGFLPVVVLAGLGAFAFRGAWDRRPVLVLSNEGVWCATWRLQSPLPWPQVKDIRLVSLGRGEPVISFRPLGTPTHEALSKYAVRVSGLDVRTDAALDLAKGYWHRFGPIASQETDVADAPRPVSE